MKIKFIILSTIILVLLVGCNKSDNIIINNSSTNSTDPSLSNSSSVSVPNSSSSNSSSSIPSSSSSQESDSSSEVSESSSSISSSSSSQVTDSSSSQASSSQPIIEEKTSIKVEYISMGENKSVTLTEEKLVEKIVKAFGNKTKSDIGLLPPTGAMIIINISTTGEKYQLTDVDGTLYCRDISSGNSLVWYDVSSDFTYDYFMSLFENSVAE